ncbi:MAG: transposase [Thermoplasmata archaeon]|nr:transposase [Thermoplasmata archaeon]
MNHDGGRWKCTCPDFTTHSLPCKHILSVRLRNAGTRKPASEVLEARRPRPTYPQNWHAYNKAQNAELELFGQVLARLVEDVEDPRPVRRTGRPRLPLRDVLFCAVEKVYYRQPLRVAHGLYERSHAEERITCTPSHNMPSLILRQPEVGPILHDLIAKSALGLASVEDCFAVDSSGFRTTSFGDYCRERYGASSHNVWIKGHIVVGAKTQIIPKVIVTDGHAGDCPQFPGLIDGLVAGGFVMKEVYADKGYLSGENFAAVGEAGGTAYIMFKENSRGRGKHRGNRTPFWKQMWHRFKSDPSAYLERYYQREIVEATFAAMKKRLGETISSRNPIAQFNELLCKVLAHNIQVLIHESFENGIPLPGISEGPGPASTSSGSHGSIAQSRTTRPTELSPEYPAEDN